jgi:cellobiose-specific phosphotransferase system component IIC
MEMHFGQTKKVEIIGVVCAKLLCNILWLFGLHGQQFRPMPKMSLERKLE